MGAAVGGEVSPLVGPGVGEGVGWGDGAGDGSEVGCNVLGSVVGDGVGSDETGEDVGAGVGNDVAGADVDDIIVVSMDVLTVEVRNGRVRICVRVRFQVHQGRIQLLPKSGFKGRRFSRNLRKGIGPLSRSSLS